MGNLTPAMKQFFDMKRQYPDAIIFFRMGDFYETFFDDAKVTSKELDIVLTSRGKDSEGNKIPLAGIPYHALEPHLARMVKRGYKVAICEQIEDPRTTKKLVQREVTRVLTPRTVVEEILLEPKDHNYLSSLCISEENIGLAFMDLSTADFLATEFLKEKG